MLRLIASLLVLGLLAASPACAAEVAYIADLSGKVIVQQPGAGWIDGAIQMRLQEGARVRVEQDARVALVFLNGDFRVVLRGPKEVIIQADGPRVSRLEGATAAEILSQARASARTEALRNVNDPRAGSHAAVTLRFAGPRRSDARDPLLTWTSGEPLRQVEVAVSGPSGPPVFQVVLPGTTHSCQIPAQALKYGEDYRVVLNATTEDGLAIRYQDTLALVPDETATWLAKRRSEAERDLEDDPADASPWIELLNAYTMEQLDERQLEVIDRILAMRADPVQTSRLYRQKIGLLMDRGQYDEAIRTYDEYLSRVESGDLFPLWRA